MLLWLRKEHSWKRAKSRLSLLRNIFVELYKKEIPNIASCEASPTIDCMTRNINYFLQQNHVVVVVVVVTRPLPRDGGMAEDHEAQKPGNSPRPGPEIVRRQRVAKV